MFEHDPEVLAAFSEESLQRLADLEKGLLLLEREPQAQGPDLLNALFRDAHSIKAGAGLLELSAAEKAAHKLENVLDRLRSGGLSAAPAVCQALLDGVDLLREILEAPATPRPLESDGRLHALAALGGG